MGFKDSIETKGQDLITEENIESLKQELERKKAELKDEWKFHNGLNGERSKTDSDYRALKLSQNTIKKIEGEIRELEEKIEKM